MPEAGLLSTPVEPVVESPVEAPVVETPPVESQTPTLPSDDWRMSIKDEKVRSSKSLATVKDLDALAKGYDEAQKYIGGAVKIPAKDAAPEEWDKFYAKLGRPASADKYEITTPKVTVDGTELQVNNDQMTGFKAVAHKAGLTGQQAQAVIDYYAQIVKTGREALGPKMSETREQMKSEWGGAFDRNLTLAQRAAKEVGGTELIEMLDKTGLGNHPVLLKMFAKVGHILSEDGAMVGDVPGVMNENDAKAKIAEVMNNKEHPYHSSRTAGHAEALEEMQRLFQLAYSAA